MSTIWKKKIIKKTIRKTVYVCKICKYEAKTEYQKGYHQATHNLNSIGFKKVDPIDLDKVQDQLKEMVKK